MNTHRNHNTRPTNHHAPNPSPTASSLQESETQRTMEEVLGDISAARLCLYEALSWVDSGSDCADQINEALRWLA